MLFAEGEEDNVLRAAIAFKEGGYGTPVLVGRDDVHDLLAEMGVDDPQEYEVLNSRNSPLVGRAVDYIYAKHQRHGLLRREVERMVNQDRNYFASAMLALGEADAMITGTTRPFSQSLRQVRTVIDDEGDVEPFGVNVVVSRNHTVLIADTAVTERPTAAATGGDRDALARPLPGAWGSSRASPSSATPPSAIRRAVHVEELRDAVKMLEGFKTDFEFEGEMAPDVALNYDMQKRYYPFTRLSRPGQHPGHAGAAVGEPVDQAAARARRGKRAWALSARACGAGADRADDRDRFGPGPAGGACRRATPMRAPSAQALNPLDAS